MKTKFAQNFSAIIKSKGISQSQFARLYGVKANTVNQWANGKREPTFHDLAKICTLLNVSIEELIGISPRTRKELLRDIIGTNADFQREQRELDTQMRSKGKTSDEIIKACNELYAQYYARYKEIFNFED